MDVIMESCPAKRDTIEEDGVRIPRWQGRNLHWYIITGQHTTTAFWELANLLRDIRRDLLRVRSFLSLRLFQFLVGIQRFLSMTPTPFILILQKVGEGELQVLCGAQ